MFVVSASTLCSARTHAPTMGNSASPGLGDSATHGLRDVGSAELSKEVERPSKLLEPNRKSQETNRKSQQQLPVPSKSYSIPTYVVTVPESHRQTDRQTIYCGITALCVASHGKKCY